MIKQIRNEKMPQDAAIHAASFCFFFSSVLK